MIKTHKRRLVLMMALALYAALLQSSRATAATWQLPNQAGGQIVLTDQVCLRRGFDVLLQAYVYAEDGSAEVGRWAILGGLVHVSWSNASRSIYPMDGFVAKPGTVVPVKPGDPKTPSATVKNEA